MLFDLVKAYERVALARVWERGLRMGFPRHVLVLSLEACAFARRLFFKGAVSEEAHTLTALLAGLGFANELLFMVMSEPMDSILLRWPSLTAYMVADDITITMEGQEDRVAQDLDKVTGECIRYWEEGMGMKVSRNQEGKEGKSIGIASSAKVRRGLARLLGKRRINVKRKVRNLGVDYSAGGKVSRAANVVRQGRVLKMKGRFGRALRMGHGVATSVTRVAFVPSVLYGVAVHGVNEQQLTNLRSMAARARGRMGGRSVTARLLVEDADPAYYAVIKKQIGAWIAAVWDEGVQGDILRDAWRWGVKKVGASLRPHAAVTGGAGAFWSALRRVGWTSPSWHSVRTRNGKILYFGKDAAPEGTAAVDPCSIYEYLKDDY